MLTLDLPRWFDLHTHFRQGPPISSYIQAHLEMGCVGAVAMPNTRPPVAHVTGASREDSWSIEQYRNVLQAAGADAFDALIIPLYLTQATTPSMIEEGVASGLLQACKYYPPHGTTNADFGVPMDSLIGGDVLRALEETGTILCIHGEQHGLSGHEYLDSDTSAESVFYREFMPRLLESHPRLRIVCEHVTSAEAVEFVQAAGSKIGATITPQHLLFTLGDLIQGLKYHLYCLPIVKFTRDRDALRQAVAMSGQTQFFAGTDSAPHSRKVTECGCAAGCFTGGVAPQLYAMAFEEAGVDLSDSEGKQQFENFLCLNGPRFYQLSVSQRRFQLTQEPSAVELLKTVEGVITPLPLGMGFEVPWRLSLMGDAS